MNQVIVEYQTKESRMLAYLQKVKELLIDFIEYTITLVSKEKNNKADVLTRLALATYVDLTRSIPIEFLRNSSINHKENKKINLVNIIRSWMDHIINYLRDRKLPDNK